MTAFNAAPTINSAVNSVLSQSFDDLQVIVLDDGSTDATANSIQGITDTRLTVIPAAHRGRSAALNAAIAASTGTFIALNDADDESLPDRIALQVAFLSDHPDVDVVSGAMSATEGNRHWILTYPTENHMIHDELDRGRMPIANACVMFRRQWFDSTGGFSTELKRLEDFDLYYRERSRTTFGAVPEPILRYRFRTFSRKQWVAEENQRLTIVGTSAKAPILGYLRYRLAVFSQKRGLGLTKR